MREWHRKLCSSTALFPLLSAGGEMAARQVLSAVVLLNSPTITDTELERYLQLWKLYRVDRMKPPHVNKGCCYFICGDGAFKRLRAFANGKASQQLGSFSPRGAHGAASGDDEASWLPRSSLCDAVIGDMDSLSLQLTFTNKPDFAFTAEQIADREGTSDADADEQRSVDARQDGDAAALSARGVLPYLEFHGLMYDSVKDVPLSLLEAMHARASHSSCAATSRDALGDTAKEGAVGDEGVQPPKVLMLPIACQMTTDFHKCVDLIQRLRAQFPDDFVEHCVTSWQHDEVQPPSSRGGLQGNTQELSPSSLSSLPHFVQHAEVASVEMVRELTTLAAAPTEAATAGDTATPKEAARKLSLLRTTSVACGQLAPPLESGMEGQAVAGMFKMHTHVLPNVAVLGALGGRLDHEMASLSTVVAFATQLHLMLLNANNVAFACWPNGITTWLPMRPPGSSSTREEKGEGPVCGFIPFGPASEFETAGFYYDMVKGRGMHTPGFAHCPRFDGVTHTEGLDFAFGKLLSTSNAVGAAVVTVDMRRLAESVNDGADMHPRTDTPLASLPAIITCNRA